MELQCVTERTGVEATWSNQVFTSDGSAVILKHVSLILFSHSSRAKFAGLQHHSQFTCNMLR